MKNLPGVFTATKKDGTIYYRSSITHKRKHISLGSFATEKEAHAAYTQASHILEKGNLFPEDFDPEKSHLSFSKWVILTNLKNNGVYIKTPIYLMEASFLYYLAPTDVLHFSADDLFYYSTHSIMRRGGHLFVSDYGMQVNILSRYGIKNHAVAGRDYRFINGDTKDFRYTNIEIINPYYGVAKEIHGNKTVYTVKIHVNGDILVGRYENEISAAIAYNKAADILIQKGVNKKFPQNYIESISTREYVDIYTEIEISPSISNFS